MPLSAPPWSDNALPPPPPTYYASACFFARATAAMRRDPLHRLRKVGGDRRRICGTAVARRPSAVSTTTIGCYYAHMHKPTSYRTTLLHLLQLYTTAATTTITTAYGRRTVGHVNDFIGFRRRFVEKVDPCCRRWLPRVGVLVPRTKGRRPDKVGFFFSIRKTQRSSMIFTGIFFPFSHG